MATSKVVAIPEILEITFHHLPARDLLLSQRINATWKGVVTSSIALQEKSFFKDNLTNWEDFAAECEWNPLVKIFMDGENPQLNSAIKINTALLEKAEEFDHAGASLRKMYLMRPAIMWLGADKCNRSGSIAGGDLTNFKCIKLGDLVDVKWTSRMLSGSSDLSGSNTITISIYRVYPKRLVGL